MSRRAARFPFLAFTLAILVAVLTSCIPAGKPSSPPADTTATSPAGLASPTASLSPAATPVPTVTPGPSPTHLPSYVLQAAASPQTAFAGTQLTFEVAGLQPLERAQLTLSGPGDYSEAVATLRATREGRFSWHRDSTTDVPGEWVLRADGSLGTTAMIRYSLVELNLPLRAVVQGSTTFSLYLTERSAYYFDQGVPAASARRVADVTEASLATIPNLMAFGTNDHIDVYLVGSSEALKREVQAGGAQPGAGIEAGVSLYGHKRPGIYLDVSNDTTMLPHVTAHEISHQVTARMEGNRNIPHWLEEGLAEYFGHLVATGFEPKQELHWRRQFREFARIAVEKGIWVSLKDLASQIVWHNETDVYRGIQNYAQAFVTVDYVASTYGPAALRPMFDALTQGPDEVDSGIQTLFGKTSAEFERAVQDSLLKLDAHEREVEAIIAYSKHLFKVAAEEAPLNEEWDRYLAERAQLSRPQRITRLSELGARYASLAEQIEGSAPAALSEPRLLYHEAFSEFANATRLLVSFERDGSNAKVDQANESLRRGSFVYGAATDHVTAVLNDYAIGIKDVEQEATATPAA